LHIKGFHGVSLIDYPSKISSILFTGGCDFKCPFCQNSDLVIHAQVNPDISIDEILLELSERKGFIDGVVITGGEPTIHNTLGSFITAVKKIGLLVKLDTNGNNPRLLKQLLNDNLIDYIAMDIKAGPRNYNRAAGVLVDINRIQESVDLIKSSSIAFEFRTLCVPGLIDEEELRSIGQMIRTTDKWYLHQFRAVSTLDPSFCEIVPYTMENMKTLAGIAQEYSKFVGVRGLVDFK